MGLLKSKKYIIVIVIFVAICAALYFFYLHIISQKIKLPDNVNQIFMKDSRSGWVIMNNGSLISTKDKWKTYKQINKFKWNTEGSSIPSISYIDNTLFVIGFIPNSSDIGIYNTKDDGNTWELNRIDYSDVDGGAYQVFSSFTDSQNGYILYCGGAAAGLMTKTLYKTTDGGKMFKKISDLSNISGYPTGMVFNIYGQGFITCAYHGNNNSYLYSSKNQGVSWEPLVLQSPKNLSYTYINGYPPNFIGENGFMILEFVDDQQKSLYTIYNSSDRGETWSPSGSVNLQSISNYSFCNKNSLYIIDNSGKMFKKDKKANVWN